ncbi:MAG: hypothetical protein KDE28_26295, partial [Anaerolineales bacterium]|nr:hypothetical protein [Anaerolineales bacterium]
RDQRDCNPHFAPLGLPGFCEIAQQVASRLFPAKMPYTPLALFHSPTEPSELHILVAAPGAAFLRLNMTI